MRRAEARPVVTTSLGSAHRALRCGWLTCLTILTILTIGLTACPAVQAQAPAARADCPPEAQVPSAEQVQAGMRAARDRGFLWRIDKDGHSTYLYGTLHVAKLAWTFPGPRVARAMAASDTLALELDLNDPELLRSLVDGLAAAAGRPLHGPLPEPLRQRLAHLAATECLASDAFAGLSPELQIATLMSVAGRRDGLQPAYGIDDALSGWAHAAGKAVLSLETPATQLRALLLPDAAAQIGFVEAALDELESGRARPQLARMAQVWADADLDRLTRFEEWCECLKTRSDRDAMTRLVDDRNPALAAAIDALHASGKRLFAAVGSLHMVGPGGLPARLEKRGYRVERITAAP